MQLGDAIKSRKSVRNFSGENVNWKKVIRCLDFARFTPMAGNLYSLKFILVENKESLEKITSACQQNFIRKAGAAIIVVSDREKIKKLYDYNNKGFAQQQAGAAIQNILLCLTENKMPHCWVGFFDDNLLKEIVRVPQEKVIEAIIVLGIESKTKLKNEEKTKPELENIVFFEKWGNEKKEPHIIVHRD